MSAPTSAVIQLTGRMSYPNVFVAKAAQPGQEPKFSCNIIMDKVEDAASISLAQKTIQDLLESHYGKGKVPKGFKLCLREGIERDADGYGPEVMFVSASHKRKPLTVNQAAMGVTEQDNLFYPGCVINMTVTLWLQDNSFGKRINANLRGVQFVDEDEEFGDGGGSIDAATEFKPLPGADVLG